MQHFYKRRSKVTNNYLERKMAFVEEWDGILKKYLSPTCVYTMYLEISPNGLLHWHGTAKVTKPESFNHAIGVLKYVYDIKGVDVDTIDDVEYWKAYTKKDNDIVGVKLRNTTKVKPTILDYCNDEMESSD